MVKNEGVHGGLQNVFLSHQPSHGDTPVKSSSTPSSVAGDRDWTTRTFVVVPVECKGNVIQWFFLAGRLDKLPAFMSRQMRKREPEKGQKPLKSCYYFLKILGLGESEYRSRYFPHAKRALYHLSLFPRAYPTSEWNYCDCVDLEIYMIHITASSRSSSAAMR